LLKPPIRATKLHGRRYQGFVRERFRHIDRILLGNEATIVRLASMESRLTGLEGSVVHAEAPSPKFTSAWTACRSSWIASAGVLTVSNGVLN
jgi:hypothetical protein